MKKIRFIILIGLFHQLVILGSRPLVALLANDLGASKIEIGIIAATFAFFPLLFAVRAGGWIDRWGYFQPILIGSIGVSLALFLPFTFPSLGTLYLSQTLAGISQIFVNISLQNALGLNVKKENRDKIFGWFSFAVSGGQFLGPLLIGYGTEKYGFIAAFLIATLLSLIPILLGFFLFKQRIIPKETLIKNTEAKQENATSDKLTALQIFKIKGMHQAMLASMLGQFTKDVMMTYFPLFAIAGGLSETEIGLILGLQGLSSMLIRVLQGKLLVKYTRKVVLLTSLFIGGFAFIALTFFHHTWYFASIAVIMGLGLGLAQPVSLVMVVNLSPPGQNGQVLGLRIAGNRAAQMISPILFGAIAQLAGLSPIFWVCGSILIFGSFYSTANMKE